MQTTPVFGRESATVPLVRHRLAILGYHKIGEPSPEAWETWFYVSEKTFADHLEYLHSRGWQVIGAETLLSHLRRPEALPERVAMITFDDGYRSVLTHALPWLRRFSFPGVIFVPTGFVGGRNDFDRGAEPYEPMCSWDELRALDQAGVAVESHSVSHPHFSELSPEQVQRELAESKAELERQLGKRVRLFAFPYGDDGREPDRTSEALAQAGYEAAFLYAGGLDSLPAQHRFRIQRVAMGPDTDMAAALGEDKSP
jgi:peptidoglycan/xylan/chitin deacetylase (PgdA/CDA1 family)